MMLKGELVQRRQVFAVVFTLLFPVVGNGQSLKIPQGGNQSMPGRSPASSKLKIGFVYNTNSRYVAGCGCYLGPPSATSESGSLVLLAEIASTNVNRAWMKIDGRVTTLRFVSSTYRPGRDGMGSKFTTVYRGDDVTARVNFVVTNPNVPGGEVTGYAATITVIKGNRRGIVKAVGECGC